MSILAHPVEGVIDGDVGAKLGITNLNEVQWKSADADDVEGWSNWSGEIFKNNNWYHLAVVNNTETATVEVFINGNPILRNRSGAIHNGINAGTSRSGPWIIGGGGNFQDTNSFHGRIGEVRITEGALPQEQWLTGRGNVEAPEPAIAGGQLTLAVHSDLVSYTYESDAESGKLTSATPATITAVAVTVTATATAGYGHGVDENGQRVETISWTLVNDAYEEPEEPAAPGVGNGFYISNLWESTSVDAAFSYGRTSDEVLVGDWDGDGVDTFAVRRGNTYHVLNSIRSGDADEKFNYGRTGDVTHVGDWNGDGSDTFAVTRGNTFFVKNSLGGGSADQQFTYGRAGDEVFAGDFEGDGLDTLSIRRGNVLYVNNRLTGGSADFTYTYGNASDALFIGDFDGDGIDTPAVRR